MILLKQGDAKHINNKYLLNENKKTSKVMVRSMSKLASVTYKALIEIIDGNQKTATVVAEAMGRVTGTGPDLGFVVLANSAWRTEIKPKLIPFLNDNLPVVVDQIEALFATHPITTFLLVTGIGLVSAYNISPEIDYPGLSNEDSENLGRYLKEKSKFLNLLEKSSFSIKK